MRNESLNIVLVKVKVKISGFGFRNVHLEGSNFRSIV